MNRIKYRAAMYIRAAFYVLFAIGSTHAVMVTVNPRVEHHMFEGWGTSICWWGNIIADYPEQSRDSIMDMLLIQLMVWDYL